MDFYTHAFKHGNNILYRGVKNNRRIKLKVSYTPTLYVPTRNPSDWKTLSGDSLEPILFPSIKEASDFVKQYGEVSNFKIYGNSSYSYSMIADEFPGIVEWDIDLLKIYVIDIEVASENGFPSPQKVIEPVTAITVTDFKGNCNVFGCGDYIVQNTEIYHKCFSELDLLQKFISFWSSDYPDILTGWNSKLFDIPYLYNRLVSLFGEKEAKKLSPWNIVHSKTSFQRLTGKEVQFYDVVGISHLDYIDLYKNFAKKGKTQENYRLDTIANSELGDRKLSYDEYDNLHQLYKLNFQKFIEYNIKDTTLIVRLEDKLKLVELALTLSYDTKSLPEDVFTQTRMWDANIYNYLLQKHIIIPPKEMKDKDEAFEGAYVKDPQIGMHEWVASFDLNSLYPHLILQYNISPECLIEPSDYTPAMKDIIRQGVNVDGLLNKRVDLSKLQGATLTPNNQFFRTDKQGFLPEMLATMYDDRKKYKKLMLQAEQELENATSEEDKKLIEKRIARYNNLQMAKKVGLNSAYGAMGTPFFRFYDIRMALAVTLSGQLSIRWIENKLNGYMNALLKTDDDYVIASDTDSIYLKLKPLIDAVDFNVSDKNNAIRFMDRVCEEKIQPFIDKSYQELADYIHAFAQKMQMKREVLADKGIWTAKKRYILNVYNSEGVQYKEPHLKIMGLETAKSSTPTIVRERMKDLIKIIVNKSEKDVQNFIEEFKKVFKTLDPEEVSFPRGVNGLNEYSNSSTIYRKGTPIHVKGSLLYNHFLMKNQLDKKYPTIKEGEKIKFTYLREPNPLKSPVIAFPGRLPVEFNLNKYVDYNKQFEKTFLDPMSTILGIIGWRSEPICTLESFFED